MYAGAAGLGRSYLGQDDIVKDGRGSTYRFNMKSARGGFDPSPWSLKRGYYSNPGDIKFAEDVYRFQHDVQCSSGPSYSRGEFGADPYKRRRDCRNRDGMLGNATMCLIVKAIQTNMPHWGKFWSNRMNLGQNIAQYYGEKVCALKCSEVACNYKAKVGCTPCRSQRREVDADIIGDTVAAPPRRKPPARRKPPVRIPVPVVPGQIQTKSAGLGGGGLFLGVLAIGGIWWLAKKRKNKR